MGDYQLPKRTLLHGNSYLIHCHLFIRPLMNYDIVPAIMHLVAFPILYLFVHPSVHLITLPLVISTRFTNSDHVEGGALYEPDAFV
jgi:hypothetical protein